MKFETLYKAYKRLVKKKYTTRADLARNCDFSKVTAGAVAKELISLGVAFEKQLGGGGKLSAREVNYTLVRASINFIEIVNFDKALSIVHREQSVRNYSFSLIENIAMLEDGKRDPSEPCDHLFLLGVPENETLIFSELLGEGVVIIPEDTTDPAEFMREYMLKSKIAQKALEISEIM